MLAAALLSSLTHTCGATGWTQIAGRTPIPTAQEEVARSLRAMPLPELLALQPGLARAKQNGEWILRPEVAEMRRRVADGELSGDDWRVALTDTHLIVTRPRWPAGVPLQVGIGNQAWLPYSMITVRAVEPDLGEVSFDDTNPASCGNCEDARKEQSEHQQMRTFPSGTMRVVFEVTVLQREDPSEDWPRRSKNSRLLWKGRMERPIQAVATAGDVLPVTNNESDTRFIRQSLNASWFTPPRGPEELIIGMHGQYADYPALRTLGVSLVIELWDAACPVQAMDLDAYVQRDMWDEVNARSGLVRMVGLSDLLHVPNVDLSNWELRVHANPAKALGTWEAERLWNGSFTIPLSELLKK